MSLFSGLNNLRDITLSPAYSPVRGFTEAGLVGVLAAELEGLDRELFGAGASVFYTYFAAPGPDIALEDAASRAASAWLCARRSRSGCSNSKSPKPLPQALACNSCETADKYRAHSLPILLTAIEFDPAARSIAHCETAAA